MVPDRVEVWLIDTDAPPHVLAELEPLLDDRERDRADRMGPTRNRHRYIAAHGASRCILGARLDTPPATLRWRRGEHGKPELVGDCDGLRVNLSHSGRLAALAIARHRPVGVDVQELTPHLDAARMAARFFPEPEARAVAEATGAERLERFTRLWVRKEACVKAVGERLMRLIHLPVSGSDDDPAEGDLLVRDPAGTVPQPLRVRDVPVPAGFHAAVALLGPTPYRLLVRRWTPPSVDRPGGTGHAAA